LVNRCRLIFVLSVAMLPPPAFPPVNLLPGRRRGG
jgi:hypothetical protein